MKTWTVIAAALLLAGCAATPVFKDIPARPSPAPSEIARDVQKHLDQSVLWGGMVLELHEFDGYVEIEVLGFPIDAQARPVPQARDGGRFIALRSGSVDTLEVTPGRFITLSGKITGERSGQVNGTDYLWPEVDALEIHLWPRDLNFREKPRISVGIGIRGGW
jgi:outer membrane lipoprotein